MEEESHTCISCGFSDSHEWNEGICDICHRECLHSQVEQDAFDSHKCSTCGASADHEWDDMGHCFTCNYMCEHEEEGESTWLDGVCSICGKECEHHWEGDFDFHHCTICESVGEHNWESNGKCIVCEYKCPHVHITGNFHVPAVDYEVLKNYYDRNEFLPETEFRPRCRACNKSIHLDDEDLCRYEISYDVMKEPECIYNGSYTCSFVGKFTSECDFSLQSEGIINSLGGHAFSEEKILCEDGYHHYVCTRDDCGEQSEDKYAKMFGKYREVTGDENPTATIQMTKVGNYYYTSLYTDFPYTLSMTADNNNVCKYTVSSAADGVVTLRDINDVPANCGVIIIKDVEEGTVAECTIKYAPRIYNSETTDASPLLTGSETDVTSPAAKQYAFGLSDTGYLGFWHWTVMTIPAWSAYLDLGSETVNEAKGFRMVFEDGTTAIEQVPAKATTAEGRYDLMGRKVNDIKGLGIVDGKKVYVPRK